MKLLTHHRNFLSLLAAARIGDISAAHDFSFTAQSAIADIVARYPTAASEVFEKHKIDFCCDGSASLESACAKKTDTEAGLEASVVLSEIQNAVMKEQEQRATQERNWASEEDVNAIIDHILEDYHTPLRRDLNQLGALVDKVARVHGDKHPELRDHIKPVFHELEQELLVHLQKEETILFPLMRGIYGKWIDSNAPTPSADSCVSVQTPIGEVEHEHEVAGQALQKLRSQSNDYTAPSDGCASYRRLYEGLAQLERDLHRHIHLENYVLHPLVGRMEREVQQPQYCTDPSA